MDIRIINPNTSASMTALIGHCAQGAAAPGTRITALNPKMGPASIESHYDEALCVPGLLEEIRQGERDGVHAYVIACFGDPGLHAARELARGPVIGIAEAAMHMACLIGNSFSVVTTLQRTCAMAWHLAERYGMRHACRNVHASDLPVLDLEKPGANARDIILQTCRDALAQDRSDCIVLGCAGMADLCQDLSDELHAPVIDGVVAAVKLAQALVEMRLSTSKRGDWAQPLPKTYTGILAPFALT